MKNTKRGSRKTYPKWTPDKDWLDRHPKKILSTTKGKELSMSFRTLYDQLSNAKHIYEQHVNAARNLLYKNLLNIIGCIHEYEEILSTCDWSRRTPVSIQNWGSVSVSNLLADSDGRFFELLRKLDWERQEILRNLFHTKPKRKIVAWEPNLLNKVDHQIKAFNTRFRDRVCFECNWSIGTYYRKIREFNCHYVYQGDYTYTNLSNAHKEMIIKILGEEYNVLWEQLMKYGI